MNDEQPLEQRIDYLIREVEELYLMACDPDRAHLVYREFEAVRELFDECRQIVLLMLEKRLEETNGKTVQRNSRVHGNSLN
jgi:hypothetical protein